MTREEINQVLFENTALIHKHLQRLKHSGILNHMFTYDDAFQTCAEAIVKRLPFYDPTKGKLSTFIWWVCEGALSHIGGRTNPLLCVPERKARAFREESQDYVNWTDIASDESDKGVEDEVLYEDLIQSDSLLPEDIVCTKEVARTLYDLVSTLSPTQQYVLIRRFGLSGDAPETLETVGAHLHLSKTRIRQIEYRALVLLKYKKRWAMLDLVNYTASPETSMSDEYRRLIQQP